MKRLNEALASLDLAIDSLEDTAANHLATNGNAPRKRSTATGKPADDDMGGLFSADQLNTVKARLDDAIERLESALEVADGTR